MLIVKHFIQKLYFLPVVYCLSVAAKCQSMNSKKYFIYYVPYTQLHAFRCCKWSKTTIKLGCVPAMSDPLNLSYISLFILSVLNPTTAYDFVWYPILPTLLCFPFCSPFPTDVHAKCTEPKYADTHRTLHTSIKHFADLFFFSLFIVIIVIRANFYCSVSTSPFSCR